MAVGVLLAFRCGKLIYQRDPVTVKTLLVANWYGYRDQTANGAPLLPHRTEAGLVVLVPDPSPLEQRCYEVGQPCSPYLFSDLESRGKTFQDGFRRRSALYPMSIYTLRTNEIQRNYPRLQ